MSEKLIKSISFSNEEIIKNIIKLHIPNGVIDCDPTFSKGNFYKNIERPKLIYDINPIVDGVEYADCRHLPIEDESINSIMFDPPFLATKGKSLVADDNNNIINKRFGVYPSEQELYEMYTDSVKEFQRVLRPQGILIFKCQDKVSSGKQYMTHCDIYNMCLQNGYTACDLFVLLAKSRLTAEWQRQNQKNARKYHSYFWVFKKI